MMGRNTRKRTGVGIISLGAVPLVAALGGPAPAALARTAPAAPAAPASLVRANMSYALYQARGGRITCGFDGYTTTRGRHEGIDIARGVGSDVHALVGGKIIYIARGHTGRSGLSTISIYNASLRKTVIYLHSAPRSSLRVGQTVGRGQVIADESWNGVSSRSTAHTHVEMRLGSRTHAAKSVGDPHLDNPNPGRFWNSQGYNVR